MSSIEIIKIGLQIATFFGTIVVGLGGIWAFKKITENHLKHMDMDLKDIIGSVKKNTDNIVDLTTSIAYLKGRFGEKE